MKFYILIIIGIAHQSSELHLFCFLEKRFWDVEGKIQSQLWFEFKAVLTYLDLGPLFLLHERLMPTTDYSRIMNNYLASGVVSNQGMLQTEW